MRYSIVPVTPFQQNCSILCCESSNKAAVVDPGGDIELIIAEIDRMETEPVKILLTHGHLDHVGASAKLSATLKIPIIGPHRDDQFWFEALPDQCKMFGFPPIESFTPNTWLEHGSKLEVGDTELEVIHCPGHTPGHLVFFDRNQRLAVVGDVLFNGSIGRTDFPRGDHATLIRSIRENLWPLGDDVAFIPGHGPMSTFGDERLSNPYVGEG